MISVVTATLNAAATLERTLSAMAEQRASFEHLIQDGGSKDATCELIGRFQTRYPLQLFQESDRGIYDAVSRGMAKARGDVLAWLGADDYYLPWTLSTVERVFQRHPEVDWIIGLPAFGYEDGRVVKVNPLAPVYLQGCIRRGWHCAGRLGFLQQEAMFWRRSLWEKVNAPAILENYRYAGDYHLWRAFARHARLWTVSSVLAVFSSSPTQVSSRLRGAYLQEVGHAAPSMEAAWWGKLANRMVSIVANHRVLRPEAGLG